MNQPIDLLFDGVSGAVRLHGPERTAFAALLPGLFSTWPCHAAPAHDHALITLDCVPGAYRIAAPWLDKPLESETRTSICTDLAVDLTFAWINTQRALCLHCAAARYAGRLVLFPGTNRAGKSLLMARLLAEGRRVFCDDLLAITAGAGRSFGVPPRLRLPLPESETAITAWVHENTGIADNHALFLSPNMANLAHFGETLPLGAVVMLERHGSGPAELRPAWPGDSVRNLAFQNFMRPGAALQVLDCAGEIVRTLPSWTLSYSRLDDAAKCLLEAFRDNGRGFTASAPGTEPAPAPAGQALSKKRAHSRRSNPEISYIRSPGVHTRVEAGECFLVDANGDRIFQLNPTGRVVWEWLAEALCEREAAQMLSTAFPQIPLSHIEADVGQLFTALKRQQFIMRTA